MGEWNLGRAPWAPGAFSGMPRNLAMQATMNRKIKFRESFRPFAPLVLQERAAEIFELSNGEESPYMLIVAPVRKQFRRDLSEAERNR